MESFFPFSHGVLRMSKVCLEKHLEKLFSTMIKISKTKLFVTLVIYLAASCVLEAGKSKTMVQPCLNVC